MSDPTDRTEKFWLALAYMAYGLFLVFCVAVMVYLAPVAFFILALGVGVCVRLAWWWSK